MSGWRKAGTLQDRVPSGYPGPETPMGQQRQPLAQANQAPKRLRTGVKV